MGERFSLHTTVYPLNLEPGKFKFIIYLKNKGAKKKKKISTTVTDLGAPVCVHTHPQSELSSYINPRTLLVCYCRYQA